VEKELYERQKDEARLQTKRIFSQCFPGTRLK
jgi:hypothetical protein